MIKSHLCKPHLVSLSSSSSPQWDVPQASRWCPPYRILPNTCTNISLTFEDEYNRQTMWGQWRLKYTEVQSQQMAFTQSPSLSNNPMIVTNFLIFTDRQSDKIETQARNTNSSPTWFQHVVTILGARTIWHQNIKSVQFRTKKTNELFGTIDKKQPINKHQNNIFRKHYL